MNIIAIKNIVSKIVKPIMAHSSEILIIGGAVGVVAGTVVACVETTKLNDTVADVNKEIAEVKETKPEDPTKEEKIQYCVDICKVRAKKAGKIALLYAPSFVIESASIVCMFKGYGIIKKKLFDANKKLRRATELCIALDKSYSDYRSRVIEEYGEEADQRLYMGLEEKTVEEIEYDKNGNPKVNKNGEVKTHVIEKYMTVADIEALKKDPHLIVFDEDSQAFDPYNPDYNYTFALEREFYANRRYDDDGYIFDNTIREMFRLPLNDAGQDFGKCKDDELPYENNIVKFGRDKDGNLFTVKRDDGVHVIIIPLKLDPTNGHKYIRHLVFADGSSPEVLEKRRKEMTA